MLGVHVRYRRTATSITDCRCRVGHPSNWIEAFRPVSARRFRVEIADFDCTFLQRFWTWPKRTIALSVVCALELMLLGDDQARAAPMHVMESRPAAEAVMDGRQTEFFIRFDGPVDHAASVLTVLQDGRVIQVLHPRLNSRPNTLYSGVRRLAPGAYVLHWMTRSMPDRDVSEGEISFSIK
jgi:methionine-rich copper-binding protein CopC